MKSKISLSILFFISLSFSAKAIIHHIEDTIRSEVFLKMIPMKSSRLDKLGIATMESQIFRENDNIVYQSKSNQIRKKGKIIRFKNGEMWVHNTHSDKIDKVKIEDISNIRQQYTFWGFASFLLMVLSIYFLLAAVILLLFALISLIIINNGSSINQGFPSVIFISFYGLLTALIGTTMGYFGLKNLLPFRKYRAGKYKAKLYEIKPID